MRKKTTVGLLTFILLAAVLLTGCGKTKTDSSNEEISITFMNQDDTLGVVKLQSGTKLSKESYASYENLDGAEFKGWYETPSFMESSKKDLENEAFSKNTTLYGDFRTSDVTEDTHKWYIAGSSEKGSLKLNNWAAELSDEEKEQFELKPTGKQTNEFAITIDLFVGDEYQLISDWSWDNQLGYGRFTELDASQMENAGGFGGTDETANVKVAADGKYTITLITNPDNPAQIQISVSVLFFFPILWLVLASFSGSGSIYDFQGFFPQSYSGETYHKLFMDTQMYDYPRWLLNTLFVSAFSCLLSTLLVILTAYTMSRFRFRMRKVFMKTTLVLSMFPSFMGMTAVYLIMVNFNLINNLWSLVLVYSAGAPMGYLVQKGYFDTINNAIYEAAQIDGASNATIFFKITLPMSKPILVYTALTSFAWPWSDFILPNMLLKNRELWTVAVGLTHLGDTEFARFAAGAIFIAVPIVILYFSLSKFLVAGVSDGAVK